MFITTNASLFTYFNEVCFNGDPFVVRIQETRGTTTKIIGKDEGHTAPYVGYADPDRP
jgi:hypothetical protein